MDKVKLVIGFACLLFTQFLLWSGGWLLYDLLDLWQFFTVGTWQNVLLTAISVLWLGGLISISKTGKSTSLDPVASKSQVQVTKAPDPVSHCPPPPEVTDELSKIREELQDLKVLQKLRDKREEPTKSDYTKELERLEQDHSETQA